MPPWLPGFRAALEQNRRQRSVQVATGSPDRGPTVRTVILRRVLDDGTLVFFTDTRAEKVAQLWADDRVEVHAWWTKGRVQYRLRGRATVSTREEDDLRTELWRALAEEDLVRFFGPPPGSPRGSTPPPASARLDPDPRLETPAETFAAVRVHPSRVDVLVLDPEGHTRTLHTLDDRAWTSTETEP